MKEKFEHILRTTCLLFQKFGIKSITMDYVAQENTISKKTLYSFVKNKTELVKQVIKYEFQRRRENFNLLKEKNLNAIEENIELMKIIVKMMEEHNPSTEFDLIKYYPAIHKEIMKFKMKNIYTMVVENIKAGKEQGLYRKELDEKTIAKMHVMMDLSRVDNEFISYKDLTSKKAIKEMFMYHLHAMCNEKGLKVLYEKIKEI